MNIMQKLVMIICCSFWCVLLHASCHQSIITKKWINIVKSHTYKKQSCFSDKDKKIIDIGIGSTDNKLNYLYTVLTTTDNSALYDSEDIKAAFENLVLKSMTYEYTYCNEFAINKTKNHNNLSIYSKRNFSFLMNVYRKKSFKEDKSNIAELLFTVKFGNVGTENEKFSIKDKRYNINVLLCRDYVHGAYRIIFGEDKDNLLYTKRDTQEISDFIENNWYSKNQLCNETIEEITDYMLMSDKNTETHATKSTPDNSITVTETNPTNTKTEVLGGDKDTVYSTPTQVNEEQKKDGGLWAKCFCWLKSKLNKK